MADNLAVIEEVCDRIAAGDFENRVPLLGDDPQAEATRQAINRVFDVTDAFVRESGAALTAAADGRFHRKFLPRGMRGAYAQAAETINRAGGAMRVKVDEVDRAAASRLGLADQLRSAVLTISEQVATAAAGMGTTAKELADFAHRAVDGAEGGLRSVSSLKARPAGSARPSTSSPRSPCRPSCSRSTRASRRRTRARPAAVSGWSPTR